MYLIFVKTNGNSFVETSEDFEYVKKYFKMMTEHGAEVTLYKGDKIEM